MDYMAHFSSQPDIMGGECCIRGTRIPLRVVLANIGEDNDHADILRNYPALTEEDLQAAIAFAADFTLDRLPARGLPAASRTAAAAE